MKAPPLRRQTTRDRWFAKEPVDGNLLVTVQEIGWRCNVVRRTVARWQRGPSFPAAVSHDPYGTAFFDWHRVRSWLIAQGRWDVVGVGAGVYDRLIELVPRYHR